MRRRTELTQYAEPVAGSLADVARNAHTSLAESFLSADCICIVDVSSSMNDHDGRDGMSRYEVACDELAALQQTLPGKIAVLAFSEKTVFCPNGVPIQMGGGTDLAGALTFAKVADVADMRFIVISDGEPDDQSAALRVAKTYTQRIDVIYVGSEVSPRGRDFLTRLAKASGGQAVTADRVTALSDKVQLLLAA